MSVREGEVLDPYVLAQSVNEIYSLDVFDLVDYDLVVNEAGETGIQINAVPRDWGPNYLQFGLELSNDFQGNSDFRLSTAYTRNALNALGGELRVTVAMGREDELSFDFYQPVDPEARWFVQPVVFWQQENYDVWDLDTNSNIATLELGGLGADLGFGRNFSTTDRVKLNYKYVRAEADVLTGPEDILEEDKYDIGELVLSYSHDSLDSAWFPTEGASSRLSYTWASRSLGASTTQQQATALGSYAWSMKRYTALVNYEFGYSFDDAAPLERWYRLGGLSRPVRSCPEPIDRAPRGAGHAGGLPATEHESLGNVVYGLYA